VAQNPWGICKGDFNGDGKDDIATGNSSDFVGGGNNVSILLDGTTSVTSGSICIGASYTIVPSGASSYTFSSGSAVVSPTGTSSSGCSTSAVCTVTVVNCAGVGIQTLSNIASVNVFPVPFKEEFTIELTSVSHITISDVLGKVVYANNLFEGKHIIDLSSFNNGIYILKAESNNVLQTAKLIKE
jgi:hypothetical protein